MASRGNSLGDLVVRLGADIAEFRADMGKAARVAQKELGSIERSVQGIQSSFRNLGRGLVAGLSTAAFASFVKSGIDAAEQLSVVSKRTGIAVEDLSVLKFAAEQSDTSFQTLTTGLQKFEQNLAKAGISGTQTIGMLTALADRIQQTEDPAKRLEIAVKAFGKAAGPELVPFLAQGSAGINALIQKLRDMGGVITGDTATAADEFNDQLAAIQTQLSAVATILGGSFIQGLGGLSELRLDPQLVSDIEAIGTALGQATRFAVEFADKIAIAGATAAGFAAGGPLGGILAGLGTAAVVGPEGKFEKLGIATGKVSESAELLKDRIGELKGRITEYRAELDRIGAGDPGGERLGIEDKIRNAEIATGRLQARLQELGGGTGTAPQPQIDQFLGALGGGKKKGGTGKGRDGGGGKGTKRDEFAEAMEGLQREIAMVGELTNAEKILFETQQGRYKGLTEAQKLSLVGAAEQLDAATAAEAQERKAAQALDEMEASARELLKPVGELDAAFFEYNLQLEELQTLLDAGRLSQQEFAAATDNLRRQFEEANFADPVKKQSEEMLESVREAARDMQNAMSGFFFDILQGRIDDFGSRFKAFIDQMVADWLASQIQMAIFGKGFGDGGGLGGILGSLFGGLGGGGAAPASDPGVTQALDLFAKGGAFAGGGKVIPFARGGLVGSPTLFPMANGMGLMGEAGPEAVLPLKRLAGGNLGVMAQLSDRTEPKGTGDVIVNFHLPGLRDDSEFKRSVGQSARNAAQLLERASRRNG